MKIEMYFKTFNKTHLAMFKDFAIHLHLSFIK